jgi:hypothetical protein
MASFTGVGCDLARAVTGNAIKLADYGSSLQTSRDPLNWTGEDSVNNTRPVDNQNEVYNLAKPPVNPAAIETRLISLAASCILTPALAPNSSHDFCSKHTAVRPKFGRVFQAQEALPPPTSDATTYC